MTASSIMRLITQAVIVKGVMGMGTMNIVHKLVIGPPCNGNYESNWSDLTAG